MDTTSVVVAVCSASSRTSAGMFQMTQCTRGDMIPFSSVTASGSSKMMATLSVPSGALVQARGGYLYAPYLKSKPDSG